MDIKNTKEILVALDIVPEAITALKDGAQLSDATILINNFGKIKDAVTDVDQVVPELKDLDEKEVAEIAGIALVLVKKIVEATKK